jgi:BirA family biotin operon repressor/biotin-[acetyl-CoA-carboxylase] ligase
MFSPEQIRTLIDQTSLATVRPLETVESTNDEARAMGTDPRLELPCLVIARNQTQGRGRGSHGWSGGEGALTFSLIYDIKELQQRLNVERCDISSLSLWTALGVRSALDVVTAGTSFARWQVKWPNDIMANGQKVGGVLIEIVGARVVVGIGINVNNEPPASLVDAISLREIIGRETELFAVLHATLLQLDRAFASAGALRDAWQPHCYLHGRYVRTQSAEGVCGGVNDEGALLVRSEHGVAEVRSGSIRVVS